jgi:tetratricopeptide (TPR) repeat protein
MTIAPRRAAVMQRLRLDLKPDYFASHHYLTHAYENINQLDRALVHAERFARSASAVPHARHMLGHILARRGRMKDATAEFVRADALETAYLRAERIPPEYDWHYAHNLDLLGAAYQYAGRMTRAEPVLSRSFGLTALFSLEAVARTAREQGDWTLAGEVAEQMRQHDASYAGTQYALALTFERTGNRAAARLAFAEAVRQWVDADPDLPELADARRRLDKLDAAAREYRHH